MVEIWRQAIHFLSDLGFALQVLVAGRAYGLGFQG